MNPKWRVLAKLWTCSTQIPVRVETSESVKIFWLDFTVTMALLLGYREVEPEDFHRFGSFHSDGNLRRACPQFRQDAPLGIHCPGRRSRRDQRGSVALYPFRPDGHRDSIPEVHPLRRQPSSTKIEMFMAF